MIEILLSKRGKHRGKYVAFISDEDEILTELNWCVDVKKHRSTSYAFFSGERGVKILYLHRAVLSRALGRNLESNEFVDHIDGDGLNNRRENLRLATYSQNNRNRGAQKTNTSGYKGVSWDRDKWRAQIWVDNRQRNLGRFDTPEEAYEAYKKAAIKYHGEFANLGTPSAIDNSIE